MANFDYGGHAFVIKFNGWPDSSFRCKLCQVDPTKAYMGTNKLGAEQFDHCTNSPQIMAKVTPAMGTPINKWVFPTDDVGDLAPDILAAIPTGPRCDCGAAKTYGAAPYTPMHATYCAVAAI
jgi:hypothetical protein